MIYSSHFIASQQATYFFEIIISGEVDNLLYEQEATKSHYCDSAVFNFVKL